MKNNDVCIPTHNVHRHTQAKMIGIVDYYLTRTEEV
jgi:hypothetical protein